VFVDRRLVEGIDLRRLGLSSRGADLLGHLLEALQGSTGEEDPGPLAGKRAGYRAAYLPSRPVDHRVLVLEQHLHPPVRRALPCATADRGRVCISLYDAEREMGYSRGHYHSRAFQLDRPRAQVIEQSDALPEQYSHQV
jgi:hypothetical protein